jgi:hypothetical protein
MELKIKNNINDLNVTNLTTILIERKKKKSKIKIKNKYIIIKIQLK